MALPFLNPQMFAWKFIWTLQTKYKIMNVFSNFYVFMCFTYKCLDPGMVIQLRNILQSRKAGEDELQSHFKFPFIRVFRSDNGGFGWRGGMATMALES